MLMLDMGLLGPQAPANLKADQFLQQVSQSLTAVQ